MKYVILPVAILMAFVLVNCNRYSSSNGTNDTLSNTQIMITANNGYDNQSMEFGVTVKNAKNTQYTYNNNKMTLDQMGKGTTENEMLWENSTNNVSVIAYYPYRSNLDVNTGILIDQSVGFDQSTVERLSSSDYLYYSNDNIVPNVAGISIPFTHALSKLNIKITIDPQFNAGDGALTNPITNVVFMCAKALFDWNINTNSITPQGIITPAVPFEGNYIMGSGTTSAVASYEAIQVPQLVSAASFEIEFTINNKSYTWSSTKDITLEQNKAYVLDLNVTAAEVVESSGDLVEVTW